MHHLKEFLCVALYASSLSWRSVVQTARKPSRHATFGPSRIVREADDDPVAAKVDGVVILRSELEERVRSQVEQFRAQVGRSPSHSGRARASLLNHLIDRTVLTAEGKRLGLTVDEARSSIMRPASRAPGNRASFHWVPRPNRRDEAGWRTDQQQHLLQSGL